MGEVMNISNTITCIRIVLAPIFALLASAQEWLLATLVLLVAVLTDVLDGYVARKRGEVTELGVFLDSFADKVFMIIAAVSIFIFLHLPWYFLFVLTRDILAGLGSLYLLAAAKPDVKVDLRADWTGKTVTGLQMLVVGCILIGVLVKPIRADFINIIVLFTGLFGLFCSVHYLLRAKKRGYI